MTQTKDSAEFVIINVDCDEEEHGWQNKRRSTDSETE
jgi:hypothetical protein